MTTPLHLSTAVDETANFARVMYNGFRFPFARHSTASFSPEMTDDGRATKYVRLDLHIEFVWVPLTDTYDPTSGHIGSAARTYSKTATTDATFASLRKKLVEPGQPLRFIDQGIGEISVQDGTNFDVNNGPKPKVVSANPIAGSRALNVVWECSTWIPNCPSASVNGTVGIAQLPYSVSWSIDGSGVTSRTISGSVEIPLSRNPSTGLLAGTATKNSADSVRDDLIRFFPRLLGFNRTNQAFTLSEDRKTLKFLITDQEIPSDNPFFPGIANQKVNRRYSSTIKDGFTKWQGSVNGTIEVAPGFNKLRAWVAFAAIFEDIFKKRNKGRVPNLKGTKLTMPTGSVITIYPKKDSWGILTSISIDEELYGRSLSFSFTYMLMTTFDTLFSASGLFQPLTISQNEASWQRWRTSLSTIQGDRGWRQLKFDPNADVIVDLCSQPTLPASKDYQLPNSEKSDDKTTGESPPGPDKDNSYIHASSDLQALVETGVGYVMRLLQGAAQQESPSEKTPKETGLPNINQNDKVNSADTSKKVSVRQVRPSVYKIVYSGKLIRAGFPCPIPELKTVGGVRALKVGSDQIIQKQLGVGTDVDSGQPLAIYGLSWRKEYVLESPPLDGSIDADGHIGLYT
jgi:hypothetical protein